MESGTRASTRPSLPNSIKMCTLYLWTLTSPCETTVSLWHVLGGGGVGGVGQRGPVECVSKQNGCFPLGVGPLLSPAFVHKTTKEKISNWNVRFNCPLCCVQLTVMLQMQHVEKSHFWQLFLLELKNRAPPPPLPNSTWTLWHWCALHSWLNLVACLIYFISGDQHRCSRDTACPAAVWWFYRY